MAGNDIAGDRRTEHSLKDDVSGAVGRLIRENRPLSKVKYRQAAMRELVRARASAVLAGISIDMCASVTPNDPAVFLEKVNKARSMMRIAMENGAEFRWEDLDPDVAVLLWVELERLAG